jgi:tetratricopeptide (TPR) repeat protein
MLDQTIDPAEAQTLFEQAFAAHGRGEPEEAEAAYQGALEADPNHAEALHFYGILNYQQGENWRAEEFIRQSLREQPNRPQFHYHLGLVLEALGRIPEALEAFNVAVALQPEFAEARNNRCGLLRAQGRLAEAEADARAAIELRPDLGVAHTHLAWIHHAQGDSVEALVVLDLALAADEANPEIWGSKVAILLAMDRLEEVEATARQALARHPGSAPIWDQLGQALRILGRPEEAIACHQEAIRLDPENPSAYYNLANFMAHYDVGLDATELEARYLSPGLAEEERVPLAFGLGDFYAARQEPERAFQFWLEGNQIVRRRRPIMPQKVNERVASWCQAFPEETLERVRGWGHGSDVPIFVVGMPRSGTTLIEQILSAHPLVAGAGEAGSVLGLIQREIRNQEGELDPERWDHLLDPDKAERLGAYYVAQMQRLAGEGLHIVNKSPGNYPYIGLIQAILPNARVICCRRDPLDSGLSIFSKNFQSVEFSYALEDIGVVYRGFQEAMDHWRAVADPALLTEIQYEDLVADPEANVAALLVHCNLPWDDACLRFFENPRPVRTASSVQVRQPLYRGAVERWRRFGNRLLPLARTIGQEGRVEAGESFDAYSRLGKAQLQAGRYRDAVDSLRLAMMQESAPAQLHEPLGRALEGVGRMAEAKSCYRQAWEHHGGDPKLALALARVCLRSADLEEAASWLENADTGGGDTASLLERATLHLARWEWAEAEAVYETILTVAPENEEALLGLAHSSLLREAWAELAAFRSCLGRLHPDSPRRRRLEIRTLLAMDEAQAAEIEAGQLLAEEPTDGQAYLLLARSFGGQERFGEAEAACREARAMDPELIEAESLRAFFLERLGHGENARQCARHAVFGGRESVDVWYEYARVLNDQGAFDEALVAARRAAAVDPGNRGVYALQAAMLERVNRLDEAEAVLAPLQVAFPEAREVRFWAARLARRRERMDEAMAWISPSPVGSPGPAYWAELGQIQDQRGRPDEAIAAFTEANRLQAEQLAARRHPKEAYLRFVNTMDEAFGEDRIGRWEVPSVPSGWPEQPAFLVGFPRSGTTLLHHSLESHPGITVLEEQPTTAPLHQWLRERYGTVGEGIQQVTQEELRELQALYRETRDGYLEADAAGRLVIDKLPLRTVEVGLLYRLFPDARFLFARRHPCDCILSAFMQQFAPNSAMASFRSLEDAVHLYGRVMTLWKRFRENLGPLYREVRYEDLVTEFDATVTGVLDFLGMEWTDAVRDFRSAALERGAVRTTSYAQVSQPLYQSAIGRWQMYSTYFEPFLPELAPWIQEGGYETR